MVTDEEVNDIECWLGEVRNGNYTKWSSDRRDFVTLSSARFDVARKRFGGETGDRALVIRLFQSDDEKDVLIAHAIGRDLVCKQEAVLEAAKGAYERHKGKPLLVLSIAHDLMEDSAWLALNRESFATYVLTNRVEVRKVVLSFVENNDAGLLRVFGDRLRDVLGASQGRQTLNNPGKAFVYMLYLELLQDSDLRRQALALIGGLPLPGGDAFSARVKDEVCQRLRATEGLNYDSGV